MVGNIRLLHYFSHVSSSTWSNQCYIMLSGSIYLHLNHSQVNPFSIFFSIAILFIIPKYLDRLLLWDWRWERMQYQRPTKKKKKPRDVDFWRAQGDKINTVWIFIHTCPRVDFPLAKVFGLIRFRELGVGKTR